MSDNPDRPEEGRISTDRETIRGWATERGAVPVRYGGSDDDYRFVREADVGDTHERVEWDAFFADLDERDHVVIDRGEGTDEPFEVTSRDDAMTRMDLREEDVEERLVEGETVTTEVTETTVVEEVVVEHATIESELVGTETVDQTVVDVDLVRRECTDCDLVEDRQVDARELFDEDRYFETLGGETHATGESMGALGPEGELPYHADLEVEEAWSVTRELDERLTVESRVVEEDVTETDTVEDHEVDVDVEGIQRSIVESDVLGADMSPDEVMTEYDIETDTSEGETIRTYFDRQRVVVDEVVDRRRLRADVVEGELLGMETIHTQDVEETVPEGEMAGTTTAESGMAERGTTGANTADSTDAAGTTDAEPGTAATSESETTASTAGTGGMILTDDERGKTVVDATGDEVGMVTDVEESGEVMRVDAHPSITERIKATLDWGGGDEDDYPVEVGQIERVTDDTVELKGADELEEGGRRR